MMLLTSLPNHTQSSRVQTKIRQNNGKTGRQNHSKKPAKTRALFVLNKKQSKSEQHRENTEHRDDVVTIMPNHTQTQQGQVRTTNNSTEQQNTKAETTEKNPSKNKALFVLKKRE